MGLVLLMVAEALGSDYTDAIQAVGFALGQGRQVTGTHFDAERRGEFVVGCIDAVGLSGLIIDAEWGCQISLKPPT